MSVQENNKGITLIGLVVTVIILLILAGVSLNLIAGSDGILKKADRAIEENSFAIVQEKVEFAILEIKMDFIEKGQKFDRNQLEQSLLEEKDANISNFETDTFSGVYILNHQKVMFTIEEDFSITVGKPTIDGSTIEKLDDVKIWLECANLQEQYPYDTMEQVLSNDTCLRALMNSKNAVDYMLRSQSVIMPAIIADENAITILVKNSYAVKKVLTDDIWLNAIHLSKYKEKFDEGSITPQNTDKGLPIASSYVYDEYKTEYAFDGQKTTQWWTNVPNGSYIGYDFEEPINIYKIVIKKGFAVNQADYYVRTGHIQYSDDGENWINAYDDPFDTTMGDVDSSFVVNVGSHRYWRITCESNRWMWDQVAVGELEMYGKIFEI